MSAKTGRNDPCPCGSGKKAKHCHGVDGPTEAEVSDSPDRVVSKALDWLEQRHLKAVRDSFSDFVFNDLWPEQGPAPEELDARVLDALMQMLHEVWFASGDIRLGTRHHRVVELVRGALGAKLAPDEIAYLNELEANWHRLYRVLERAPDGACMLMDALDLSAEPLRVEAPELASGPAPGTLMGARIITVGGRRVTSGVWFEFPLTCDIRALNFVTEVAAHEYGEEEDRAFAIEAEIATCWIESMLENLHAASPAANDEDGEGDDETWNEDDGLSIADHYEVLDDARLTRILDACPELAASPAGGWTLGTDDQPWFEVEILRATGPARLEVHYGSADDAQRRRPWFEELAGDAVRFLNREIIDPLAALDEEILEQFGDLPPELMARLALGVRPEFEPDWLDEPLPELDGASPLEAAKTRAGAAKLRKLLLALEADEAEFARKNSVQPFPMQFLWDSVGLDR